VKKNREVRFGIRAVCSYNGLRHYKKKAI